MDPDHRPDITTHVDLETCHIERHREPADESNCCSKVAGGAEKAGTVQDRIQDNRGPEAKTPADISNAPGGARPDSPRVT